MSGVKSKNQAFLENVLLLENIQGGIVYSDAEPPFRLRYATEGMANLCGYEMDEITDLIQMDIVHPDDQDKLLHDVGEQFSRGNTFSVEYRLLKKDGSFVHVLDRAKIVEHEDGKKYIHCILTDITEMKDLQNSIRLNEEKLKIALFQSGNVVFDLTLATQVVKFSENFANVFDDPMPTGKAFAIIEEWVQDDYKEKVMKNLKDAVDTGKSSNMELKLNDSSRGYVWASIHMAPVKDDDGIVYAIIGSIQNIDEQYRRMEKLTDLSQRDSLTGIFNRLAMETLVNESARDNGALVIIDIDFFKQVNDQYGHAYGDEILKRVTSVIERTIPREALFGRLGGDEFLIYMDEVDEEAALIKLLQDIIDAVGTIQFPSGTKAGISLGATRTNEGSKAFVDLYKRADIALYESKDAGRGCYHIYKG